MSTHESGGHNPSPRGSQAEQQGRSSDVRPTLDHLVELVGIRIVRDGKRRLLAIKAVQR